MKKPRKHPAKNARIVQKIREADEKETAKALGFLVLAGAPSSRKPGKGS